MKQYIRDMIDDLQHKHDKDLIPSIPPVPTNGKTTFLGAAPIPADPADLDNQVLSEDPLERTRQLDFQAQQNEERETS